MVNIGTVYHVEYGSALLLCFVHCIQLWALLHFVMPTLFDSHAEFNEWFSKDIENRSEKKTGISESKSLLLVKHHILDSSHPHVPSTAIYLLTPLH